MEKTNQEKMKELTDRGSALFFEAGRLNFEIEVAYREAANHKNKLESVMADLHNVELDAEKLRKSMAKEMKPTLVTDAPHPEAVT